MQEPLKDSGDTEDSFSLAFSVSLIAHAVLLSLPLPYPETSELHPSARSTGKVLTVDLPEKSENFPPPPPPIGEFNPTSITTGRIESPTANLTDLRSSTSGELISAPPPMSFRLTHELEQPPVMLSGISSTYTQAGTPRLESAQGELVLRLIVDVTGKVTYVQPLRVTIPRAVADEIVLRFVDAAYQPGMIGGEAVTAEMLISISVGDTQSSGPAGRDEQQPATNTLKREP